MSLVHNQWRRLLELLVTRRQMIAEVGARLHKLLALLRTSWLQIINWLTRTIYVVSQRWVICCGMDLGRLFAFAFQLLTLSLPLTHEEVEITTAPGVTATVLDFGRHQWVPQWCDRHQVLITCLPVVLFGATCFVFINGCCNLTAFSSDYGSRIVRIARIVKWW